MNGRVVGPDTAGRPGTGRPREAGRGAARCAPDAQRRLLLGAAAAAVGALVLPARPAWAVAAPQEVAAALPGARLQGSGKMRVLGLHVYDARLWAAAPLAAGAGAVAPWADAPVALEVLYARRLVGAQIAERSLVEMRRQGEIAEADAQRWLAAMTRLFPDVGAGDRLTGVNLPGRGARFYANGTARGEVAEPAFAQRFFGIWLAPQTSAPALREALLGAAR